MVVICCVGDRKGVGVIVLSARAQVFGDLIEADYDLHRSLLYRQLRRPLPINPVWSTCKVSG